MLYLTTIPSTSSTTAWARATTSFLTGVKHRFPPGCAVNGSNLRVVFANLSSQESAHQSRHVEGPLCYKLSVLKNEPEGWSHSYLRATDGSTCIARRAGR